MESSASFLHHKFMKKIILFLAMGCAAFGQTPTPTPTPTPTTVNQSVMTGTQNQTISGTKTFSGGLSATGTVNFTGATLTGISSGSSATSGTAAQLTGTISAAQTTGTALTVSGTTQLSGTRVSGTVGYSGTSTYSISSGSAAQSGTAAQMVSGLLTGTQNVAQQPLNVGGFFESTYAKSGTRSGLSIGFNDEPFRARMLLQNADFGTDNPFLHWRGLITLLNKHPTTGSSYARDDSAQGTAQWQMEFDYTGGSHGTLSTPTNLSGTATRFAISGADGDVFVGQGIEIGNGSAVSGTSYGKGNVLAITGTSVTISGTSAMTTGTLYIPVHEWNATWNDARAIGATFSSVDSTRTGSFGWFYPFIIDTRAAITGNYNELLIDGSYSSASGKTVTIKMVNEGLNNGSNQIVFNNATTGKNYYIRNDVGLTGADNFGIYDDVSSTWALGIKGGRLIVGASPTTDDGSNKLQVAGNSYLSGNLRLTGSVEQQLTVSDTNSSTAVQATSNNAAIFARRSGMSNGSGGQSIMSFYGSPAASPASFVEMFNVMGDFSAGSPAGVTLYTRNSNPLTIVAGGLTQVFSSSGWAVNNDTFITASAGTVLVQGGLNANSTKGIQSSGTITTSKNLAFSGSTGRLVYTSGSNGTFGTVTLTTGSAWVNNTSVTANTHVQYIGRPPSPTTTTTPYLPRTGVITSGSGFSVLNGTDNSTYEYILIEVQ